MIPGGHPWWGAREIEEHQRPFKPLWGRGLCRTAHGELKNIIAFGRHQETHRPSPRRPGTRLRHQPQGDNGRNRPHSRDGSTPTATGRSSGCTVDVAAKHFIPAS